MESQLNRVSALNKTGLDAWLEATQVVADGAEKLARLQLDAIKSVLRESAERGRSFTEFKSFAELPVQASGEAAAAAEKVLGYTRNLYDTAHTTGVQLFTLTQEKGAALRRDWFAAWNDLTDAAPGGKTGGTKAALDSTRSTVEAWIDGFARTAKQSLDMTDAMVKSASDTATQAIKSATARG